VLSWNADADNHERPQGEHQMELRGTLRDFSLEAILGLI